MNKAQDKKKFIIIGIIVAGIILSIYLGGAIYFRKHFLFGTVINGESVSKKTVDEVEQELTNDIKKYSLTFKGRDGNEDKISANDFELKYDSKGKIQEIKDSQNPFLWIISSFKKGDNADYEVISFNEELLKEKINNLEMVNGNNVEEPKNATLEYTDNGYKIVDEVKGNKVNVEKLYEVAKDAINSGEENINLEEKDCYINPEYTTKSEQVTEAKSLMDKYVQSKVTYDFDGKTEVVDSSKISKWLGVDENFDVTFDEKKVRSYVDYLGYTYDTVGKDRKFVTSEGKTVTIPGVDSTSATDSNRVSTYGWKINRKEEVEGLIECIKEGGASNREPVYLRKGKSRGEKEYGDTYVEINYTKQHMWMYKDGKLVVEGDIVTGNVSQGYETPQGMYYLLYKEKDATLKGEDYETPVTYWMPFNGNIGIHDAYWRDAFGGNIYVYGGSHGCINSPTELAKTIFENISPNDPIICYKE